MALRSLFALVALAASCAQAAAASVIVESRVAVPAQDCISFEKYIGMHNNPTIYSSGCASVTSSCLQENGTSIWSHVQCVAAAACQGTSSVITLNQCQNPNVKVAAAIPNLSGAIWSSIVGSSSDSMTQQNFIDFVYAAMSTANVTQWPQVDDVAKFWWEPILDWTATGSTVPYKNFNDWLHFSSS
ncbi:hypothetical protein MIND_01242200 [Mycena indigotica]|uniref:Uncharacterized protein n=1 Tax=Mycena indigotica TaxID=2126181 RepID=A0A8H6S5F2_9AGAR|nr:uncharacterized protein MIND_01242200 [Mycena indigotica]KAF7292152.1 hypothetical protein MIND_01242200 [Mycena indigotica]